MHPPLWVGRLSWTDDPPCDPDTCYTCIGVEPALTANIDTNVWGRSLANGSFAVVVVNAEPVAAGVEVRCDWEDCLSYNATTDQGGFGEAGFGPDARIDVLDLVTGRALPTFTAREGFGVTVRGMGGSATVMLTPVKAMHSGIEAAAAA